MWTKEHRARAAAREKQVKRYKTDLTDEEWQAIEPLMPAPASTGRRRSVDLREVINAIRYLVRTGSEWRMLPHDFPPWPTVYWWFRRFVRRLLFRLIHDIALMTDRELCDRANEPTGGVIDSQSVKAPGAKERGYDAAKKVTGRKRHIAVVTDGRLLMVNMTTVDIIDSTGAIKVLEAVRQRWPWMKHLFADSAYDRAMLMDRALMLDFVVERSFGWMMNWRRLVRDYEQRIDVSESMIYAAMGSLLLRRIFDPA